MAVSRILAVALLSSGLAEAWSMTSYYNYSTQVFGSTTLSQIVQVFPTGPVTGTSSSVITTTFDDADDHVTFNYTLTSLFLEPQASWCAFPAIAFGNTKTCTGTQGVAALPTPPNPTIQTRYYVPVVITPPSTCTQTSFSYTSSLEVGANRLPGNMVTQATLSGEATFITTLVEVVSTDLGGQPVTETVVEIYLNPDAVQSVQPLGQAIYLSQCIDPSVSMCPAPTPTALQFGCGPQPITYPPRAQGVGSSTAKPAATAGSGTGSKTTSSSSSSSSSSKSGAGVLHRPGSWSIYLAVVGLAVLMLL